MKKSISTLILAFIAITLNAQHRATQGPDAPAVTLEQSNGINLSLSNPYVSNNYNEGYQEIILSDTNFVLPASIDTTGMPWDTLRQYACAFFQGYLVYQVKPTATLDDFGDPTKVLLVGQSDLNDNWLTVINNENVNGNCEPVLTIEAGNSGTVYDMNFTHDAFTNAPIQDNDNVCYLAIAYAVNPYYTSNGCASPIIQSRKGSTSALGMTCSQATNINCNESTHVSLFPNPANTHLYVTSADQVEDIQLVSAMGRVVASGKGSSMDVSDVPAGNYFAIVRTNTATKTHRVSIAH